MKKDITRHIISHVLVISIGVEGYYAKYRKVLWVILSLVAPLTANAQPEAPIYITSDALEADQKNGTATFTGNVDVRQNEMKLRSEKMIVYYQKGEGKSNNVSKIEVTGNVVLTRPGETAKGDKGRYDVIRKMIDLSGHVMLNKDNNMVQGSNLVYNLTTGESKISGGEAEEGGKPGRVKGVFLPQKE